MDYIIKIIPQMLEGSIVTAQVFLITIVLSIPLGVLLSLGRVSSITLLQKVIGLYVWLLRGTPLMLQLFFVYYALPAVGIRLDDFEAALVAFVLNYAAYFCEIFRAGIQSVPKGQYEAARTLGMNYVQTMRRIILPQVVKRILPAITNEVITLVKDTSLAFSISYVEMFTIPKQIAAAKTTMVPFVAAGIFYYIFNFVVAWVMELLEKKFSYYH